MNSVSNGCQIFDHPNSWLSCPNCCALIGVDLYDIKKTVKSYTYAQLSLNCLSRKALDSAYDFFIDLPRWRNIVKSKFLLKDYSIAKTQLEASWKFIGTVREFDYLYRWQYNRVMQDTSSEEHLIYYFKPYFEKEFENLGSVEFDNAISIKKMLHVIRETKMFEKAPEDEEKIEYFEDYFVKVGRILLSAISKYCFKDSDLVIEFIEALGLQSLYFFDIFNNTNQLEFLMHHANARKFDFWGLYTETDSSLYTPFNNFIKRRKYELVRVMSSFGYRFGHFKYHSFCFSDRIPYSELWPDFNDRMRETEVKDLYPVLPIFSIFKDPKRTSEDVELINFVMRDTSAPYVTPDRLFDFSMRFINPEHKDEYVQACSEYKNSFAFDEPNDVHAPRSLYHLSRITVRDCLRKNHQLPYGIEKLGVPKIVKKYLNMDH